MAHSPADHANQLGVAENSLEIIGRIGREEKDKPDKVSHLKDLSLVLFGSLAFAVFLFTHHLLFGGDPLT